MKVAILGSGFGLYGYLPALIGQGCSVLLPERYRAVIEGRAELAEFAHQIKWVVDEGNALDRAEAVVVARRPGDQAALLAGILRRPNLQRLLLEKPLAPNPEEAGRLQSELLASGRIVRVGYIFGHTDWGKRLLEQASSPQRCGDLRIHWSFRAHHYATDQQNWKRSHAQGGGALRFYGIQLLALTAELGFCRARISTISSAKPDEVESWSATLENDAGDLCELNVRSNAELSRFSVTASSPFGSVVSRDPFGRAPVGQGDRRIPLLASLCQDMLTSPLPILPSHSDTVALWQDVENVSVRV